MPNMLKILKKYLGYPLFLLVFALSLATAVPVHQAMAAEESRLETIKSLMTEINALLNLVKDRKDFAVNKASLDAVDHSDRSEDFFLRIGEDSASVLYGSEPTPIILETDGGVRQIVVTNSCSESGSKVLLFSNSDCVEETWVIESEMESGIKTFTVPVSLITKEAEDSVDLSVYACRFDGCVFESNLVLPYKEQISFADQVEIYDRYEWIYEWNNNIYHVQEVLLDFPYKDIKKVKLRVRCDVSGLYIATDDDYRATCHNRREYSNFDYRNVTVDDNGNTYNLLIESVTRDSVVENSGAVELEFVFVNKRNGVAATLYHRPVQEEVFDEDEEATED